MPMYFFDFHAIPANSEHKLECAGAYVCCWIQDSSLTSAEARARRGIEENGWIVTGSESEPCQTSREQWLEGEHLEQFDQALIDREVWVFHAYPHEDEEDSAS